MSHEKMFQEAVQAVAQGQIARARDLFTRLLKKDSSNPDYWLWMSAVVETTPERIYCLENVLQLDPNHQAALRGLILLGARQGDDHTPPAPVIKRKWNVTPIPKEPRKPLLQRLITNRFVQVLGILAALALVISLISYGANAPDVKSNPTTTFIVVAITVNPTQTPTPSPTPNRTIKPILMGATPLWALLEATYTPLPAYVNTPHPILEAYKIAIRSYERGDYARMVSYLEQAVREEPYSADINYLLGEGYRRMGDAERALESFETTIELNPYFAPPYLGRALIYQETRPGRDRTADLKKAIELDPYFVEAYLALSEDHLEHDQLEAAIQTLEELQSVITYEDARYYWLGARVLLARQDYPAALKAAQIANRLDETMLPAYLTLAQAYLANDKPEAAIDKAQIYLRYEPEDPIAWLLLAQAQYSEGANREITLQSLAKAIELNPENPIPYGYRGLMLLENGESQAAINDLLQAVRLDGSSFEYNLNLGRSLYAAERYNDAYRQLNVAERLAAADAQKAAVYYWRARTLESAGNTNQAKVEWKKFLALPTSGIPSAWLAYAREHLLALETSTPTATPTSTIAIRSSPTPAKTPTP